jgi:AcrR family transcriptional regulator
VGQVTFSPRQHQVLGALSRIIVKEGFDELTVAVLADRLRCSRRTLYTLAPSRDALIVGVVNQLFDGWMQRARAAATEAADDVGALVAFLGAGLDVGDATSQFFVDVDAQPETARVHDEFRRDYMSEVVLLVERALPSARQDPIDVPTRAEVLAAVVRRLAQMTHASPPQMTEAGAVVVIDDLVRRWLVPAAH